MPNYIDVLLLGTPDGTPVVVTAPTQEAREGDLVYYLPGQCGIVQKSEWFDPNGTAFQILTAVTPLYMANKVYRKTWDLEEKTDAD